MTGQVTILGAGIAGCEAAWQAASIGDVGVRLYEMKPHKMTPAHKSPLFCELVCSNSLGGAAVGNASGLIKEECRRLGSLIVEAANETAVPAGGALAVDREAFSRYVHDKITAHPAIEVISGEAAAVPRAGLCVVATGPLTSGRLYGDIKALVGAEYLSFFDAAAPVVTRESIDMTKAYYGARYQNGTPDYINCPMTKEEYLAFRDALASAREAEVHGFEDSMVFEGCMPIEVLARRGVDAIRYGPLKPVGLRHPETGEGAYAVIQLRMDNRAGNLYNLVGFQTHLAFDEQKRVFSMIPALKNAEFARYGVMHRNTYIDSPRLLDGVYRLRSNPNIFFAGQLNGGEGYPAAISSGLMCGLNAARAARGIEPVMFSGATATGALARYVSDGSVGNFQPMGINFGIMDAFPERIRNKRERNALLAARALREIDEYLESR